MPEAIEVEKKRYEFQPTDAEGNPIGGLQSFEYTTPEELAEKLRDQNIHAIRKINELNREDKFLKSLSTEEDFVITPKPLTADELFTLPTDLQDEKKRAQAIKRIAEAEVGDPERVKKRLETLETNYYISQANIFKLQNPDYLACDENLAAMNSYCAKYKIDPTAENLGIVKGKLKEAGLLRLAPKTETTVVETRTEEPRIEPEKPVTRPRGSATGIFPSVHGGGSKPEGKSSNASFAEELAKMSSDEYRRQLNNPAFRAKVDALAKAQR